jgi:hypothetical protein
MEALPEQHSVTTMQGLRDELALAQEQITRLERELAEARAQVLDWENREAAICPEDVGFEELIRVLQSKLALTRTGGSGYERNDHDDSM